METEGEGASRKEEGGGVFANSFMSFLRKEKVAEKERKGESEKEAIIALPSDFLRRTRKRKGYQKRERKDGSYRREILYSSSLTPIGKRRKKGERATGREGREDEEFGLILSVSHTPSLFCMFSQARGKS